MAPLIHTDCMFQTATYWAPLQSDGFGGVESSSPVVITCRWQDKNDLIRSGAGQQVVSSAVIYPDRVLANEGYLALGDLSDIMDPRTIQEANKIIGFSSSLSLDATEVLYKAWV